MKFIKHLSEPWFSLVKNSIKTSEGRLIKGEWAKMKIGDIIEFYNDDDFFEVVINDIKLYKSFEDMIRAERLKNVLPGYKRIKTGVKEVYYKFFKPKDEKKYGVLAIRMTVV